MSTAQANISLLEKLPALIPDKLGEMKESFADDFVWHYINPQLPQVHGDYQGIEGLQEFFIKLGGLTDNTFNVRIQHTHAVGSEFVVVHACPNMTLDGSSFEIDSVVVWRMVDQQIKEAWDIPGLHSSRSQPS
ncbi:MAG: nuclear transport factor 2 family protein [Cyanobacteria bacterium J06656_5]